MVPEQYTDERVSRKKFEREVEEFRALALDYRARGWLLADASFPTVLVVMCAPQTKPPTVVTGVAFDYTNYDVEPPSVRLVDPFTGAPYTHGQAPTLLVRRVLGPPLPVEVPPGAEPPRMIMDQPLLQAATTDDVPFLCIAGVREYHNHPAHTGDAWDLHRGSGAGRLVRLLEVIDTYGVRPIAGLNVTMVPRVSFAVPEPPT